MRSSDAGTPPGSFPRLQPFETPKQIAVGDFRTEASQLVPSVAEDVLADRLTEGFAGQP